MADVVHIVVCGDQNMLWGMAVSVRSALEHSTTPISVTVISSGFSADDKQALAESWAHPNTHSISINELSYDQIKMFRSTKYLKSKATYARYFIEDFLPQVDKVIYLDSDLLVLADLKELYETPLGSNVAAASLDISTRANDGQIELCKKLGIRDPHKYFNSGVMLIDLKKWRKQHIKQKLIDLSINDFDKLDAQDQSALNVVLNDRICIVDTKWNTVQY